MAKKVADATLKPQSKKETRFKPVVIPNNPQFDKLLAFKRVELSYGKIFVLPVVFCAVNTPDADLESLWQKFASPNVDPYLIDIGTGKYHGKAKSAAAVEDVRFNQRTSWTWKYLVQRANENNDTGVLKEKPHSVARTIRSAYHLYKQGSGLEAQAERVKVFRRGMKVINSYFLPQNLRQFKDMKADKEFFPLCELFERLGVDSRELEDPVARSKWDVTLPLFFYQLFRANKSVKEISQEINWWLDQERKIEKLTEAAREREYEIHQFKVDGRPAGTATVGKNGLGDYFESRGCNYQHLGSGKLNIMAIRNSRGNIIIQGSVRRREKPELTALYEELNRREPGLWYIEKRFRRTGHMVMNGSDQYTDVPPSKISAKEMMQLLQKHVRFMDKDGIPIQPNVSSNADIATLLKELEELVARAQAPAESQPEDSERLLIVNVPLAEPSGQPAAELRKDDTPNKPAAAPAVAVLDLPFAERS